MRSLISEFSYGFALTHEFVLSLGSLAAAPIFPSLLEEGKAGGGYDVKLEAPGVPLFLQFKRSEKLTRSSAREIMAGAPLSLPFYRAALTARRDSDQHDMLVQLDQPPSAVFYAAPMFNQKSEFDDAFLKSEVRHRSFFVSPAAIGTFADDGAHHLSFDGRTCVVMSEPRGVPFVGVHELEMLLLKRIHADNRPLRTVVDVAVQTAERARDLIRKRVDTFGEFDSSSIPYSYTPTQRIEAETFVERQRASLQSVPTQPAKEPEKELLRRLADIGLREFDAQLFVVQRKGD